MKAIKHLIVVVSMALTTVASADPGDTLWTKKYTEPTGSFDASAVIETRDGNLVCVGQEGTFNPHAMLLKVDAYGNPIWRRYYSGIQNSMAFDGIQTDDHGFIITGTTSFLGEHYLYFKGHIFKTDSVGTLEWELFFGEEGSSSDCSGISIIQVSDGGYLVAGYWKQNFSILKKAYIVKIDSSGNVLWDNSFGGTDEDYARSVCETSDGGFILAGGTKSYGAGGHDLYLVKTDSLGDSVWSKTYGGSTFDRANSIKETGDGGFIIGGTNSLGTQATDIWLLKTDSYGDTMWTKTYGDSSDDKCNDVELTSDGGYILAAQSGSYGAGSWDYWILKTDSMGDTLWTRVYGDSFVDIPKDVNVLRDGNYAVIGGHDGFVDDIWLLKLEGDSPLCLTCSALTLSPRVPNVDGIIIWDLDVTNCGESAAVVYGEIYPTLVDCAGTQFDFNLTKNIVNDLAPLATYTGYYFLDPGIVEGVVDAALTTSIGPGLGYYIESCCFEFKFTYSWGRPGNIFQFGPGEWGERGENDLVPSTTALNQNYPNPFNASTTISFNIAKAGDVNLSVYNLSGQKIETLLDEALQTGQHNINWDASTYSSGVYFYKLTTGDSSATKRMTLVK